MEKLTDSLYNTRLSNGVFAFKIVRTKDKDKKVLYKVHCIQLKIDGNKIPIFSRCLKKARELRTCVEWTKKLMSLDINEQIKVIVLKGCIVNGDNTAIKEYMQLGDNYPLKWLTFVASGEYESYAIRKVLPHHYKAQKVQYFKLEQKVNGKYKHVDSVLSSDDADNIGELWGCRVLPSKVRSTLVRTFDNDRITDIAHEEFYIRNTHDYPTELQGLDVTTVQINAKGIKQSTYQNKNKIASSARFHKKR